MNGFNRFAALRWVYNIVVPPRYREKLTMAEELCAFERALNTVIEVTNANGKALEAISQDLEDIQFGAGGYYTPSITENEDKSVTFSFVASDESMPPIEEKTFFLGDVQSITKMLEGFNGEPMEVKDYIDEMSGGYYTPVFERSGDTVTVSFTASNKMLPSLEAYSFTLPTLYTAKSAYDSYLANGGTLTEKDWVESLKGEDGESFYQMCVKNGFEGSETDLIIAMKGVGIKSVAKTSTSGLVDTYTITLTDNSTYTFTVTNSGSSGDTVNICLPSKDIAVVGREYNIYKDSIIFGNRPYTDYDIAMYLNDSTVQTYTYHEVFRFVPTKVGTYTLTVYVRDYLGTVLAEKTMTIEVIANTETEGKNVLFIGDSLTAAGIYTAEIQHNLSAGGITSVGTIEATRTIDGVSRTSKHEGRNGWATWDYAGTNSERLSNFNSADNVFRNPNTNKFDLAYYMDNHHSGVTLHAVCINLGTNGIGADTSVMNGLHELVTRIKEYDSSLPILIHLTIPEARQDYRADKSGGKNTTHEHMRRCWLNQVTAYMNLFDGKVENVHVVPVYCNMDIVHDFPTVEVAVSARNPEKIYRASDGHPNTYGYLKMADVYYAHLLKYMREGGEVVEPEEPEEPEEPTVSYTNLADPSKVSAVPDTALSADQWLDGHYISNKVISAKADLVVTNKIPMSATDTIRIKGFATEGTIGGSNCTGRFRLLPCKSDGTALISEIYPAIDQATQGTGYLDFMDTDELANGVYCFCPNDTNTASYWADVAFVRICGYPIDGDNANVIVTVNWPIA